MLDLSIIIVNFNTKDLTRDCVESIFKSKPRVSFEVIAVDNGSSDGSDKVLKGLWREKKIEKFTKNDKNLGFAKANNIGVNNSKGKHKLLLNSDTIVKKDALDKLVEFAEKTSDAGVVGARLLNPDGSKQASCYNFPTIKNAIKEYWLGKSGSFSKYLVTRSDLVTVDAVVGATFLITQKSVKEVGLLDERYLMYFEDLDYCRRVWSSGLKVYYLPKAEIVHLHGESGKDIASPETQWKRLIPSSKIYHGTIKHYIINFVLWSGQKWQSILQKRS